MSHSDLYQKRLHKFIHDVTVYPVSSEPLCNGRSDQQWLDAVLAGGSQIVQLRDKVSDDRTLYNKAIHFRLKTKKAGALLIINNRLDIAMAVEADGIHLGNTDLPAEVARQLAPDFIIGVSANSLEQAKSARQRGATYFNIGPLFPTKTKKTVKAFLGPQAIKTYSACSDLPFTVMGGIKKQHIAELTARGAQRIAVVTALTMAENIKEETSFWVKTISQKKNSEKQ